MIRGKDLFVIAKLLGVFLVKIKKGVLRKIFLFLLNLIFLFLKFIKIFLYLILF